MWDEFGAETRYDLEVMTEEDNLSWKEIGLIQRPDMSVQFIIHKGKQVLIRIDKESGESGTEISCGRGKKECFVETILEGRAIELYFNEKTEERVIKVQMEQEGRKVYYLMIP